MFNKNIGYLCYLNESNLSHTCFVLTVVFSKLIWSINFRNELKAIYKYIDINTVIIKIGQGYLLTWTNT